MDRRVATDEQEERPWTLSRLLRELASTPERDPRGSWQRGFRPGQRIGRFELLRELGRGGFGVVFAARDVVLGRTVALKAIRPGPTDPARAAMLEREAEAVASLQHPNILTLFDAGRCDEGPYLVLELLAGETLAERLARGGPLAIPEALRVATDVARGLVHAHERGVLHRDLKPTNVFLVRHGAAKVLDFGVAHVFGRGGAAGGTPGYMAPEQLAGGPEDERTDTYAVGVLLHEMIAAARPAPAAERPAGAAADVLGAGAPAALASVVARCLDPVRDRRPAPPELLQELAAIERRVLRRAARRRAVLATLGAAGAAACAAALLWWLSAQFVSFDVSTPDAVLAETGISGFGDVGLPTPEDVAFVSDGLTLRGWLFRNPARGRCGVVLQHGRGSTRHGVLPYAPLFWERGCDVLAFDSRHHGASDDALFTYGAHERIDLLAAADLVAAAAGTTRAQVGVVGVSAGASIAMQTAAIAPDLAFVILESPYAELREAARRTARTWWGPAAAWLASAGVTVGGWRASFDPDAISPLQEAARVRVPALVLQGGNDPVVPPADAEAVFGRLATPAKAFHLLPWARAHCTAVRDDPREYRRIVDAFLARHAPAFGATARGVAARPPGRARE